MNRNRKYLTTHPWIDFEFDFNQLRWETWMLLGEAASKIEHLRMAVLKPAVSEQLHQVLLAKGVHATTAIEGNTLSLTEVDKIIRGQLALPDSREYLATEVKNVLEAMNRVLPGHPDFTPQVTVEEVCFFNHAVLQGLELADEVVPGEIRLHEVGVGRYPGPPAEDCLHLLGKLVEFLNDFPAGPKPHIAFSLVKAALAHLYIAWIHPFGDGNGRTARLLEVKILVAAGLPTPAAHLLSNYYNRTRQRYYIVLDRASKSKSPYEFVHYAIQGFVDEIREQLQYVWEQQYGLAWNDYIHSVLPEEDGKVANRQRHLLVDLAERYATDPQSAVSLDQIKNLGLRRFAQDYGKRSRSTLHRDVRALLDRKLLAKTQDDRYFVDRTLILAFRPGAL